MSSPSVLVSMPLMKKRAEVTPVMPAAVNWVTTSAPGQVFGQGDAVLDLDVVIVDRQIEAIEHREGQAATDIERFFGLSG
jgi:hypothetical protein